MGIDIDVLAQDWKDKKESLCSKTAALKELIEDKKIQLKRTEENIKQMNSACNLAVFKSGLKNYFKGEFSGDPFMDAAFYLVYQEDTAPESLSYSIRAATENRRLELSPLARVKQLYEQMKKLDAALREHYRKTFVFDHSGIVYHHGHSGWGHINRQMILGTFTGRKKPQLSVIFPENDEGDLKIMVDNSYKGVILTDYKDCTEDNDSKGVSEKCLHLVGMFRYQYSSLGEVIKANLFLHQHEAFEYYNAFKMNAPGSKYDVERELETPALQHLLREKS